MNTFTQLRRVTEARPLEYRQGGPEMPFYESVKVKPGLFFPRFWAYLSHETFAKESCKQGVEPGPPKRSIWQSAEPIGLNHLSLLISDREPRDLKFVLLGFCLTLLQHYPLNDLFLLFGMVMCIVGHCLLM